MPNYRVMRKRAKIGLNQASAAFGVSRQAVNAWERGENKPNAETLLQMSRLYQCSVDDLLKPEDDTAGVNVNAPPV